MREPFWKFSFPVPRVHSELDEENNNNKWKEAEDTERNQLLEYQTFINQGLEVKHHQGLRRSRVTSPTILRLMVWT